MSTCRPRLHHLAYLLTGDLAATEDLLQTTMEKTCACWSSVSRMEAPDAYVRTLMVNALLSSRRRPVWTHEWLRNVVPDRPSPPPDDGVIDHALLWPLVRTPSGGTVVVLRYYEDLSESETAQVLGCAVGTVKSQAHDAMRALRRGLGAGMATRGVVRES